ncbi:PVC-type heme-binding CxxCH protein [Daejeonella sp.]|uniref:PVC-type heme-binding CxxCH protein n=1 Tax=Daejeonella sp. TaxID=2805397 RepID=UPI0030C3142A
MLRILCLFLLVCLLLNGCSNKSLTGGNNAASNNLIPRRAEVLFLGNVSKHHDSGKYAPWLAIATFKSGINITYTTDVRDLNSGNLAKYDGLIIYANHDTISSSQEAALKNFVESGKGLIPLHSAAGCFKNSEWYVKTLGGQFASHGNGSFIARINNKSHPVTKGLTEFETTDETYVHQKINPDITVLMERVDGTKREPYTWVRTQGQGRVFYTAYGHDDNTWKKSEFLKLVTNGILWAIGDRVNSQIAALKIPDVDIYADTLSNFTARHLVPKIQEGLTPQESMKLMQVPADFEIKLFAAEPDITNPIAMSWDEKGRLWIVESVDYPNTFLETDGAANDRIKICEDTNGDGKADKFTVFADKLNIPTSMVFANGGVIVSMAPNFVFLKDTNGDDKADVRENILTGFGKNDTHAGPSNLQYGFDNKIWGVLGYSGYNGTVNGNSVRFGQGVYRLDRDGKNLEYLASTSNNTWGLGFSEDNNVFISTANNTHSAYYSMPAKYMQRGLPGNNIQAVQKIDGHYDVHAMTPNLRQVDVVGGFTSAAGHHLYTARNFPKEYWNRIALICEPTVRLIHNAIIEPKGAGFTERDGWNFLASSDEWVSPVQAEVGPDGAVWVADWYNFVIQHNTFVPRQAPTEVILPLTQADQKGGQGNALATNLRDLDRGRVYRVVYKKGKSYTPIRLTAGDTPGLLAAMESDNMFWRITAQRLLVESKDQSALPGLYKIINNQKVDEIGLNGPAINALWTLHGLGALNGSNAAAIQVATKAFTHPAAGVRKAAVEVLADNGQSTGIIQRSGLIRDPNLNVRKSVLLAIAALPPSRELGALLYEASKDPENEKDEWLVKAISAAAIAQREGFMAAAPPVNSSADPAKFNFSERLATLANQEIYLLDRRAAFIASPDVKGKELFLKTTLIRRGGRLEGVLAAQGNKSDGYALFVQDGKLNFLVNQAGKSYMVQTTDTLKERSEILASLNHQGMIDLQVDGKKVGHAMGASLFSKSLTQELRVGRDLDGDDRIGNYTGQFQLRGEMQNTSLELKEPVIKPSVTTSPGSVSSVTVISIKVVPDMMQYDKKLFTVKAGQKITIDFQNPDGMQHNLVIIKPGSLPKVGAAADAMLRDPKAAEKNYVPEIPEVLQWIKLLNSEESFQLTFTVPGQPGDYPFVCTFPGHWRGMNGIMRVIK